MKIEKLKIGKIYTCNLTNIDVLVIEQLKMVEEKKGENVEMVEKKVTIGKCFNKNDQQEITYFYQELFDGQLKEKSN